MIDIDERRLAKAQRLLGTTTKKDTVNQALAEVIAVHARRRELQRLRSGSLAELADPEVRARAWRR
jgi:Arc/MetJ family transcription regulator